MNNIKINYKIKMLKSTSSTKGPLTQGKALIQLIKDDLALNKLWLVSLNNDY